MWLTSTSPHKPKQIYSQLTRFLHVETHKVSTSIRGGVSRFTTQAMSWRRSFRTFIMHGPWTGSETVRIGWKRNRTRFADILRWEFYLFLSEPGPVRQSYRQRDLRNWISEGIRKKHIRFGNKFDWVEGVKTRKLVSETGCRKFDLSVFEEKDLLYNLKNNPQNLDTSKCHTWPGDFN